ncbi:MAG: hypothetical protein O7E52_22805 [Candidatus Poribacteria bacterium]|nr:hypothetical protein [Candidatus Poribacteria bacterium]
MRQALLFFFLALFMLAIAHLSMTKLQAGDTGHPNQVVAETTEENENPFQEKCYTCHGNEVAYKEWTHSGHAHALVNLRHGDHPAWDSCLRCHSSRYDFLVEQSWPEDKPFNVETAVNAVACASCHSHNSDREDYLIKSPRKLCVSCHKMDCGCAGAGIIHQSQSEMFLGREGAGIQRMPSPHVRVMKKRCVHCHMAKKDSPETVARHGGHTFIADFAICADCHDDMTTKLTQYREEIEAKMHAVKAVLDRAVDVDSDAYRDAKLNYDMVKGDSGYGLHNIPYARALLDYSLSLKPQLLGTAVEDATSDDLHERK